MILIIRKKIEHCQEFFYFRIQNNTDKILSVCVLYSIDLEGHNRRVCNPSKASKTQGRCQKKFSWLENSQTEKFKILEK